jgi:hypothetical protein
MIFSPAAAARRSVRENPNFSPKCLLYLLVYQLMNESS